MLPAGDLRDVKASRKRADIFVVTKCKTDLMEDEKRSIIEEIQPNEKQPVFFTEIRYGKPYHLFSKQTENISHDTDVLLLCGIANPRPLKEFLTTQVHTYDMLKYPDHHIFNTDDLADIKRQFEKVQSAKKLILTTEKDAVRLRKFENELTDLPIYAIPIEHAFLFNEGEAFNKTIRNFIGSFPKN
jgi:tetraacyldisaccharide 4'-kinase